MTWPRPPYELNSMRILLIHNRELKTGGESVAFDRESEALRALGHNLLLLEKSNRDFELAPVWRKAWLTAASVFNLPAFVALRRTIREFNPDVAIIHNPFPLWSIACYLALLVQRVPIVQMVHNYRLRCLNGLYFRNGAPCTLCHQGQWWRGVRYRCVHGSLARSLGYAVITQTAWPLGIVRRLDAFRVLSSFSRERLIEMGISVDRIHVIPNLSPRLTLVPQPTADPTWVFIGHLSAEKGPNVAVGAMAHGAPGKLLVIGDGPLAAGLRRRIVEERPAVELLGALGDADRFNVLRHAWALVFPSMCFENGPLTILEAFSVGIPVVASRIGSIQDYVTDGVTGRLFSPGDEVDLARVLRELANDPAQRQRLSASAHKVSQHRFAEGRIASELDSLLRMTVSRSRSRRHG